MVYSMRMPRRFLRGQYGRVALTLLALGCGVAQVCMSDLLGAGATRAFEDVIDTMAGRVALQVLAGTGGAFPEELASKLADAPGVKLAVPIISGRAFTSDDSGELLTIHSMDLATDETVRMYDLQDADSHGLDDPHLLLPDSIILTSAFAARRGLVKGSSIALDTPNGRATFIVRGLLEPKGVARVYGGNLAVMDLYGAAPIFANPGMVNRVDIFVGTDADLGQIRQSLTALLPQGYRIVAPDQRKADLHKVMNALRVALQGVGLVGLVGAFLIAYNRIATMFEDRTWQLGVLNAVGVRPLNAWWELVKESLLLGIGGVIVGVPMGILGAQLLLPTIMQTAAVANSAVKVTAQPHIHVVSLVVAAVLGLGASLLAAVLPAWRAVQAGAAQAARSRGFADGGLDHRARWLMRGLVVLAACIAAALQSRWESYPWGLAATVFGGISAAVLAQPLVDFCSTHFGTLTAFLALPSGRIALANVNQNSRRSALTVATLAVGIAVVLWLWTLARSFEESVFDAVTAAGALQADLVVTSQHIESGVNEAPVDESLLNDMATQVAGVESVLGQRVTEWYFEDGPISLQGFDPEYFTNPKLRPRVAHGGPDMWEALASGKAAIVSSSFIANLHHNVGDRIVVATPDGPLDLQIAGVITNFESPRGMIGISRVIYKEHWHDTKITRSFVGIAKNADVQNVRAAIARQLGRKYGLRILSSGELIEFFRDQVGQAFAGLHVLAAAVLLVVFVGVADTLAASFIERTREIGTLRAVGVRRWAVQRVVIGEGLILCAVGISIGVVTGLLLGNLWVVSTIPLLVGFVIELQFPYAQVAALAVCAVVICLIAALLPARRAARLNPAIALRFE